MTARSIIEAVLNTLACIVLAIYAMAIAGYGIGSMHEPTIPLTRDPCPTAAPRCPTGSVLVCLPGGTWACDHRWSPIRGVQGDR